MTGKYGSNDRWILLVTGALLIAALIAGGGQGWMGESLLALGGLILIAIALLRVAGNGLDKRRLRWFIGVPLALLILPLLQLLPLPPSIWTRLAGRPDLVSDMIAVGGIPGWGSISLDRLATERVLWSLTVPVGIFMAAMTMNATQRRRVAYLALIVGAVSSLLGLWQVMEGRQSALYFYRFTNPGAAVGFFANRNHLASFLAVLLPVTVGLLSHRVQAANSAQRDPLVWLLTACMIVLIVGVSATTSRAGLLLMMLSVMAAGLVGGSTRNWRGHHEIRPWIRIAVAVAVVFMLQSSLLALLSRLQADPLEDYRWAIAPRVLHGADSAWGVGFGLGTFVQAYDEIGDVAAERPEYLNHAHNDYIELWMEGGVPALLLVGGLAVVWMRSGWILIARRTAVGNTVVHDRGLEAAAWLALLLLAVHSIVDYPLRTLALASMALLMAAVVLAGAGQEEEEAQVHEPGW